MLVYALGVSLALTLALEGLFALLWGMKGRGDWRTLALVNVVTNPVAVTLHYCVSTAWPFTLAVESAVVAAEWLAYRRWGKSTRPHFVFSLCANCFSYFCGVLLNAAARYFGGV